MGECRCWFALFSLAAAVYIPTVEEPGLEERFGEDYRLYKENVPRWIPRLKPRRPSPRSVNLPKRR